MLVLPDDEVVQPEHPLVILLSLGYTVTPPGKLFRIPVFRPCTNKMSISGVSTFFKAPQVIPLYSQDREPLSYGETLGQQSSISFLVLQLSQR